MSGRLQEKLLRVIEYGEYERLGGSRTLQSRARIIGAANQDLPELAAKKKFRADLLDRLAFDVITLPPLPPLRAREEDILLLAEHFALGMTGELKREYFPGFTDSARERLQQYHWPGNVRELKSVVERAVYHCSEDRLIEDIVFDPFASPFRPQSASPQIEGRREESVAETGTVVPTDFKAHIRMQERQILALALEENRFNRRKTAERLGLSYDQLRGYLKKYKF